MFHYGQISQLTHNLHELIIALTKVEKAALPTRKFSMLTKLMSSVCLGKEYGLYRM